MTCTLVISWDRLHTDCKILAHQLTNKKFDAIVAIARGGLIPAAIIARELNIRLVDTICVKSYTELNTPSPIQHIKGVNPNINWEFGSNVLVIDDLVDTGSTIKHIKVKLPNAYFATIYAKSQAHDVVDTFVTEVSDDTWILFPYDTELAYTKPISER
jgi:xanthine phosphoribosyltransferase